MAAKRNFGKPSPLSEAASNVEAANKSETKKSVEASKNVEAPKKPLGKGLSAIFEELGVGSIEEALSAGAEGESGERVELLPVGLIDPNPQQPRQVFDEVKLLELSGSIKEHGVLEPLLVSRSPSVRGRYELLAGERRLEAAKMAGMEKVPCLVRGERPGNVLELMLVENLQREDLNPIEEARSYDYLLREKNLTQEQLSKALGKSRAHIANVVRLLGLPSRVQEWVEEGRLSFGHAKVLAGMDEEASEGLARLVVEREMSIRDLKAKVASARGGAKPKSGLRSRGSLVPSPYVVEVENRLRQALQAKVSVVQEVNDGPGFLRVEFYNNESLAAVMERIVGRQDG